MKFDTTINLSSVIAAIGVLAGGAASYADINSRLAKLEQAQLMLTAVDARQESDIRTLKGDIRDSLVEIKSDIKDLRADIKRR